MLILNEESFKKEFSKFVLTSCNKSIDQLEVWEYREALSLYDPSLKSDHAVDSSIITSIVENVIKNRDYSWAELNLALVDEAAIQRGLRRRGYELACFELNVFPTSVESLRKYLIKQSVTNNIKFSYFDFTAFLGNYFFVILTVVLAVLLCCVSFDLWSCVVYNYILMAVLASVGHDYAVHNSGLVMRNRLFYWISAALVYVYIPFIPKPGNVNDHAVHHKIWTTNQDPVYNLIKASKIKYLFHIDERFEVDASITKEKFGDRINYGSFLYDYRKYILLVFNLAFILIFGLGNYTAFYLLPILILGVVYSTLPDIVFHSDKSKERDVPWMMPIWFGTAWHITHHYYPNNLYFGPKWVRYFNLQYWVTLLLYDISKAVIL
jgi:fatty-acid desaturase